MGLYKAQTRFLFHAHIKIKIPFECDDACFDRLFSVLSDVDERYNSYQPGSYVDMINKCAGSWVEVDDEMISLVRRVKAWSVFFDGAFDVTVMPLLRLWGFYKDNRLSTPGREELERTKALVDYRRMEIDGRRVRIGRGQEIVTGSFIKAYAVDKLVGEMHCMGIGDAIVNAGGSTIYAMSDGNHEKWNVNVRDTDDESLLFKLGLSNKCYTTSSQQLTYVDILGRRYGHILNPLTGRPSLNRHVGIVTDSCFDGDAVSTGLFLQSAASFERKMAQLKELMPIEGFFIGADGKMTSTFGFNQYIVKDND